MIRAWLKERDPRVLRLALALAAPLWLAALLFFIGSGSMDPSTWMPTERFDPTPFGVALILTGLLVEGLGRLLKPQTAAGKSLAQLQAMPPEVFEDWVAARFRDLGYSVKTTGREPGIQGDHGVDLLAEKSGEIAVIQCRCPQVPFVGHPALKQLDDAMRDFSANHAYLVTTRHVTPAAVQWAEGKPIDIWDGDRVARLSRELA